MNRKPMARKLPISFLMRVVCVLSLHAISASAADRPPTFVGSSSCGTATCHAGLNTDGPAWTRSMTTHLSNDPHATAGLLLRDADSRRIVERLEPAAKQSDVAFDNVLRLRCISCHATVDPSQCEPVGLIDDAVIGAGVSCESCHGAAGDWLAEHTRKRWRKSDRFTGNHFRDTESNLGRTQNCVRCHVGSRREDGLVRDVNHDLIAAGHPAMRFDSLIYNDNLPSHWNVDGGVERTFYESSVRVREVGRAVGLAQAGRLASQRAEDYLKQKSDRNPNAMEPVGNDIVATNPFANNTVPWPELADYDCFACHQSLSTDSYRLPVGEENVSPLRISNGLPVWNAWYSIEQLDLRDKPQWLKDLSPHGSDPKRIAYIGEQIALRYDEDAATYAGRLTSPLIAMAGTRDRLRKKPPVDWHAAAVQYLLIEAAVEDMAKSRSMRRRAEEYQAQLPKLEAMLRFNQDAGADNNLLSSGAEPTYWMSPRKFDARRFQVATLKMLGIEPADKANKADEANKADAVNKADEAVPNATQETQP